MSRKDCVGRRDEETHLFVCPACRAEARVAAAWKELRVTETPAEVPEGFVERVLELGRRDRADRTRRRWLAAAAAAALFSFCAGLAHERASRQSGPAPEESYASLASPNPLGDLVSD